MNKDGYAAADFCSRLIDFSSVRDFEAMSAAMAQVLEYLENELKNLGDNSASEYVTIGRVVIPEAFRRASVRYERENVIHFSRHDARKNRDHSNAHPSRFRAP